MADLPYFSVIIPTHHRARLLRRALDSVRSQEVAAPFEIIVVSDTVDGETDRACCEALRPEDIYLRRNGVAGPSASRNLGLTLARGRLVLFLDDDDAWHPGLLQNLLAQGALSAECPVYFNCSIVTERRPPEGPETLSEVALDLTGQVTDEIQVKNQLHMSCLAFPQALLAGLAFDTSMRAYEDWDFMLAVFARAMPRHLPIMGSRVYEVRDETSDRRGMSQQAQDYNAVYDYLYVYRRHPSQRPEIAGKRAALMNSVGVPVAPEMV